MKTEIHETDFTLISRVRRLRLCFGVTLKFGLRSSRGSICFVMGSIRAKISFISLAISFKSSQPLVTLSLRWAQIYNSFNSISIFIL
jgi:hypothetical protein